MLHAVGFAREDFKKSQVGIASTWSMVTPCNMHIDKLAREAEAGVGAGGGKGIIFGTITISDGISMGSEGMKYSLVSREVIADSIETVMGCEMLDGLVAIGGCDKNMPGCLIAMARLDRPAVFVYGGTILPGCINGILAEKRLNKERASLLADKPLDIVSCFEAVGKHAGGQIDERELALIEPAMPPDDLAMEDGDLAGRAAERDETEPRPEARGFGERRGQNISDAPGSAAKLLAVMLYQRR